MVRTVKSHQEDDEIDDEEFTSFTPEVSSQKVKVEGKSNDQKVNALRSKHSETEQRRRSKINERFQILRDLIPENDQKRDKASFLLEVIQYIQFLQEKIQMYEGTYQGWSPEPSKLTPWRSNSGLVENFVDQSQLMRTGSDHPQGSGNEENSLNFLVQPDSFDVVSAQPPQGSFPEPEHLATHLPSKYWQGKPGASECAVPRYKTSQREQLKPESREASTSNVYSQGLLNTLTHALQSSGVDLSQVNLSVQLDVGKRTNGATATTLVTEDSCSIPQMAGCSIDNYDRANKQMKTDQS